MRRANVALKALFLVIVAIVTCSLWTPEHRFRWSAELLSVANFARMAESDPVAAAKEEILNMKAEHQERMAHANAQLQELRRNDGNTQQAVDNILNGAQQALAKEIIESAAANQRLSASISSNMSRLLKRSLRRIHSQRREVHKTEDLWRRDYLRLHLSTRLLKPSLQRDKEALRRQLLRTLDTGKSDSSSVSAKLLRERATQIHDEHQHVESLTGVSRLLRHMRAKISSEEQKKVSSIKASEQRFVLKSQGQLAGIEHAIHQSKGLLAVPLSTSEIAASEARVHLQLVRNKSTSAHAGECIILEKEAIGTHMHSLPPFLPPSLPPPLTYNKHRHERRSHRNTSWRSCRCERLCAIRV
jgi:hypothetical protein